MEDRLLTTEETARLVGLKRRTLEGFRQRGCGPVFVEVSARRIRYCAADVQRWVAERRRASTSATNPPLDDELGAAE